MIPASSSTISADGPFLRTIGGRPFATVPYPFHLDDIASFDTATWVDRDPSPISGLPGRST